MIERVCDQHQLMKHSLYFILKKKVSKRDLPDLDLDLLQLCKSRKSAEYEYILSTLGVERIPSRTSNNLSQLDEYFNFFLNKPNRTKYCNKQNKKNKQTNDNFFCQK